MSRSEIDGSKVPSTYTTNVLQVPYDFSSSDFNVQGHILSTSGDVLSTQ